jgi:ATP-binding cassette, subfamily B, bacterial
LFPLTLLVPRAFTRRAFALSYEKRCSEGMLLSKVQENVFSQRVVKAFGLQRRYQSAFNSQSSDWRITAFRMHFASALVERSAYVGVCLVHLAVVGLGAYWTFKGDMTLGTLVAFEEVLLSMGYALSSCTQYIPTLAQGVGSMQHLDDLFAEKPEGRDASDLPVLPKVSRSIVFRKVLFRYPGSRFSLRIDDTEIQKGTFVAIVGPSGSGKSTILNLLLRFYDLNKGAILFDGQDIRNFTKSSLQGQIGAVFQDSLLMNSSIRDNIRVGKEDASDAEVHRAAQLAEVHEFIQGLAEGYDTVVGESGAQLSGGQRQRLAIARALVRDPPILILDEATSALDHQTEAALLATLRRLATDRVVISVTHRIGSIDSSDRVLVMDHGNLTESGTHRELIRTDSFYGSYWRKHGSIITPDGSRTTIL